MMRKQAVAMLLCVGLAVLMTVGCGKKPGDMIAEKIAEKAVEVAASQNGEDVNVDISGGNVSITAQNDGEDVQISMTEGGISVKSADGSEEKVNVNITEAGMTMTAQDDDGKAMTMNVDGSTVTVNEDGKETTMTYDEDAETVQVQADDGTTMELATGDDVKLPAAFPKDVPVYTNMKLDMAMAMGGGDTSFMVQGTTQDAVADIEAYFAKEMKANDWAEGEAMPSIPGQPMRILNYTKESRTAMIMITRSEEGTAINMTLSEE